MDETQVPFPLRFGEGLLRMVGGGSDHRTRGISQYRAIVCVLSGSPTYALLSIAAVVASALVWDRFFRRRAAPRDGRLALVFIAALSGAFLGAKIAFLVAEGWHQRGDWMALLSGRSVTGALIGGTLAAEFAKWCLRVRTATGDAFAITVPLAVAIGRVGCVSAGCCQGLECEPSWFTVLDVHGHARFPSAQLELAFNLAFLAWSLAAGRFGWMATQRFNAYLVCYGVFRFVHEYWRDDHRWFDEFGGYHLAALCVAALGVAMMVRRRRLNREDAARERPARGGPVLEGPALDDPVREGPVREATIRTGPPAA